ncbi:hypothetical protein V5O48_000738 [Marasmius crinis-equi]|uniref:ferric-chelate reductase (NADPH) n=1 Tax=Marasmius crinis-equi TaxID=585013 RepID=A0ABR3G092_9AGAR
MSSPAQELPLFDGDFASLASRPNPDKTIRIARASEYPQEIWYFLACFIGFVSLCRFVSWAVRKTLLNGSSRRAVDDEKGTSPSNTAVRWRRLPSAVMNLYRIVAFRLTVEIGAFTLNLAEVALTCMYMAALFTWAFINTTNVAGQKFDPNYWNNRCGALVASQLPLITALGTKNSVISLLTGVSFEKLNYLHRMVSRVVFVLLCTHAGSRIQAGLGPFLEEQWLHMGMMAGSAFLLLCIVTMRPIRTKSYELFFYTHITLVVILLVGAYYHTREFGFNKYVWPSFVIWGLDRSIRGFRLLLSNYSYFGFGKGAETLDASVELLSPKLVRLTLKRPPHFHWSPGQTAFLIMPDVSTLPFETHPFTIASFDSGLSKREIIAGSPTPSINSSANNVSAPESFWKELVFLVNVREGFTKRLAERAAKAGKIKVYVDGPYGVSPDVTSYDTTVLVAGKSAKGRAAVDELPSYGAFVAQWISEAMCNALLLAPQSLEISVDIFVTRSDTDLPTLDSESSGPETPEELSPTSSKKDLAKELGTSTSSLLSLRGVRTFSGRPDLKRYLQEQADLTGDGRMSVNVCGSQSIANATRGGLSFSVAGPRNVLKGGPSVTLHVETFGYA